jgi:AcrR family transcriptional regulator
MALYKHLSNKEALLDGMVDRIVPEIGDPLPDADWKRSLRHRILSARRILLSHPWASAVIESRAAPTPVVLGYMNSIAGTFLEGGFPPSLAHQAMHALGSRMWGFTQELFPSPPPDPAIQQAMIAELEAHFPHIVRVAAASDHAGGGIVGGGCDDQAEFEFALDLLLDGLERLLDHTVGSH